MASGDRTDPAHSLRAVRPHERVAALRLHQDGDMSVTVPIGLRQAVGDDAGGQEWLDSIPARAARAVERWDLVLGEPFETGMAGWTAPATTAAGADVVVKLSYPHREARDEAAALTAWHGAGAVEVLGADADDWALLLRRVDPAGRASPARRAPRCRRGAATPDGGGPGPRG